MSELLESQLWEWYEYPAFRPGQKEIIQDVLKRNDVLAVLPTGTGKTLCYQFPSRLLPGITVVVSPLLSLMEDQVHQLKAYGEKGAVALNSHVPINDRNRIVSTLTNRSLLYVSPEMLQNEWLQSALHMRTVGLFVVDEAHCISQWGHEFRTDYLKLADVRKKLNNPPCLALTATATKNVQDDIVKHLCLANVRKHLYSVDRPNIALHVSKVTSDSEKKEQLVNVVKNLKKPGVIYTGTRLEAESVATLISQSNVKAAFYHGGMTKEDRLLVQQQFIRDELDIVCCTNAFGMGINKENVHFVIHYHLPQSVEHYVQEIGRAGRGGEQSLALLIYQEEDRFLPLSFIDREVPVKEELEGFFYYFQSLKQTGQTQLPFEEFAITFRLEETQKRLLYFHFERLSILEGNSISLQRIDDSCKKELEVRFKQRQNEKRNQFLRLETLLNSERECLRKGVLVYFDEELAPFSGPCCSTCGSRPEDFYTNVTNEGDEKKRPASWEKLLIEILHQGEKQRDKE
ncbi:RecQ family ATP-dependent DNA helicase [Alteribacter populi]|uniref:RecQ family ATP-dependent DNA helicase n=1 Tax=Alteribacter populi TaxID=2011011 RepID=UPI000BBB16C0|nr:ATP-dependent DNA helicase RecQ [Alteribacter populi]